MFVRVAKSQEGKDYRCLVVKYRDKTKLLFVKPVILMDMLNVSPEKFYTLPLGDYEVK